MKYCPLCSRALDKKELEVRYVCPHCGDFIMSFGFIAMMQQMKPRIASEKFTRIIDKIREMIKSNPQLIAFVDDYDSFSDIAEMVVEFHDITDMLGLTIQNISRGSDYGD